MKSKSLSGTWLVVLGGCVEVPTLGIVAAAYTLLILLPSLLSMCMQLALPVLSLSVSSMYRSARGICPNIFWFWEMFCLLKPNFMK